MTRSSPERAYTDGILGACELSGVELFRDVFVWAYERSCARYSAVRQSLGELDPFRLRYLARVTELMGLHEGNIARKSAAPHASQ